MKKRVFFVQTQISSIGESKGFTLIEMLLSLVVFSLMTVTLYQTLLSTSQTTKRVSQTLEQQQQVRAAHRTIRNAVRYGGMFDGTSNRVVVDLSQSDSTWLEGTSRIEFTISERGDLWAYLDGENERSLLLSELDGAEFSYFENDVEGSTWESAQTPKRIDLNWSKRGKLVRWSFNPQ